MKFGRGIRWTAAAAIVGLGAAVIGTTASAHPAHDLSGEIGATLKGRTYDGVVGDVSPGRGADGGTF